MLGGKKQVLPACTWRDHRSNKRKIRPIVLRFISLWVKLSNHKYFVSLGRTSFFISLMVHDRRNTSLAAVWFHPITWKTWRSGTIWLDGDTWTHLQFLGPLSDIWQLIWMYQTFVKRQTTCKPNNWFWYWNI